MRNRATSGGARQRLWSALRGGEPVRTDDLYERTAVNPITGRAYLRALAQRGYLAVEEAQEGAALVRTIRLEKDTGPRAPTWSVHTDDFRDWNLDQAMTGDQLRGLVEVSGLSIMDWLRAAGINVAYATRLRQMMAGQRPISDRMADHAVRIAAEARRLREA